MTTKNSSRKTKSAPAVIEFDAVGEGTRIGLAVAQEACNARIAKGNAWAIMRTGYVMAQNHGKASEYMEGFASAWDATKGAKDGKYRNYKSVLTRCAEYGIVLSDKTGAVEAAKMVKERAAEAATPEEKAEAALKMLSAAIGACQSAGLNAKAIAAKVKEALTAE